MTPTAPAGVEFEDGPSHADSPLDDLSLPLDVVSSEATFADGCASLVRALSPPQLVGEGGSVAIDPYLAEARNFRVNNNTPTDTTIANKVRPWPYGGLNESSVKVLCATYTHRKKHRQAMLMRRAWGWRCNRHIIFTDQADPVEFASVPPQDVVVITPQGGESYDNMWQKSREIFKYLTSQRWVYGFDFYVFAGDDAFLVPENLRKMASEPEIKMMHDAGAPLFFGYRQRLRDFDKKFRPKPVPDESTARAFVSGAGYVLNTQALLTAGSLIAHTAICSPLLNAFHEDVTMAECLEHAGVNARDARDVFGEDRFSVLNHVHFHYQVRDAAYSWWWAGYRDRQSPSGLDIVSEDTVLFHFVDEELVEKVHSLIYKAELL